MKMRQVTLIYFSATGTTRTILQRIGAKLAERWQIPVKEQDFTLPDARKKEIVCTEHELVLAGVPVYAGRVPNVLLPYWKEQVKGHHTLAVPIVLFGNRAYDNALIELRQLLEDNDFRTVAGAAFVGEHSFSDTLAAGRPDADDLTQADQFAEQLTQKIEQLEGIPQEPVVVKGEFPIPPYYKPKSKDGKSVSILKVTPKVSDACDNCGRCVTVCPMGSIDPCDVRAYTGICIKCGACIKGCPKKARYYDDEGYLYHKHQLEENFSRRAAVETFL